MKLNTFCEWLNEMESKVNKCNVVPSAAIEETLKKLHLFVEEHAEKQSLFSEIEVDCYDNIATTRRSIEQFKVRFFIIIFLSLVILCI